MGRNALSGQRRQINRSELKSLMLEALGKLEHQSSFDELTACQRRSRALRLLYGVRTNYLATRGWFASSGDLADPRYVSIISRSLLDEVLDESGVV